MVPSNFKQNVKENANRAKERRKTISRGRYIAAGKLIFVSSIYS